MRGSAVYFIIWRSDLMLSYHSMSVSLLHVIQLNYANYYGNQIKIARNSNK